MYMCACARRWVQDGKYSGHNMELNPSIYWSTDARFTHSRQHTEKLHTHALLVLARLSTHTHTCTCMYVCAHMYVIVAIGVKLHGQSHNSKAQAGVFKLLSLLGMSITPPNCSLSPPPNTHAHTHTQILNPCNGHHMTN